jgi:hypothetical protein
MTRKIKRQQKKQQLQLKINSFLEDSYFDIQGLSPGSLGSTMDEQYLARVLTKMAIGSATVWWSILEVKDFLVLRKKSKGLKNDLS